MPKVVETIENFAGLIYDLGKSDRDIIIGTGGFTGEGKSVFMILLQMVYAKISGTEWNFNNLTWDREEMLKWIDGDSKGKGQLPEYTALLVDELISLFFRRNWYEDPQKRSIELLNKCRDRHLFIGGNIPNFWELDTGFQSRVRFYIYIPRGRGVAWVFEQEDNPFTTDKWNTSENKKLFRKRRNPYTCPNFLCEIHFGDLSPQQKKEYIKVRNTKRRDTELQSKKNVEEKYGRVKQQRDNMLRFVVNYNKQISAIVKGVCVECKDKFTAEDLARPFTNKDIGTVAGISTDLVRLVRIGQR